MTNALPFTRRKIAIGGRDWIVDTVEDEDALLAFAETSAQFPFGLMLWESAVALAHEIMERPALIVGKSVLELGAGLGLCGVVAAQLGGKVVQTDHDASALVASARTAELNGVTGITREPGDWHDWQLAGIFDVILGADVTYDGADHAALRAVLDRALSPCGTVLLADPGRESQALFIERARAAGWQVKPTVSRIMALKPSRPDQQLTITSLELRRA